MPVEQKVEAKPSGQNSAPVSDYKEFTLSKRVGYAQSCSPSACGGGPGGACQGGCNGCREYKPLVGVARKVNTSQVVSVASRKI